MKQDVEHVFAEYKEAKRRFVEKDISMRCIKKARLIDATYMERKVKSL